MEGSLAETLGQKNPYRCRGYSYDKETGLYYLGSRYYNPEIGRFINADTTDILLENQNCLFENNLYTYYLNNPVNMVDVDGYMAQELATAGEGFSWGIYFYTSGATATSNFWNPIGWVAAGIFAVGVGIVVGIKIHQTKKVSKPKKQAKKTAKDKASDAPSWANSKTPNKGEKADDFSKRILNDKYGEGKWKNGPGSEFSEIKKWAQRSLGLK